MYLPRFYLKNCSFLKMPSDYIYIYREREREREYER